MKVREMIKNLEGMDDDEHIFIVDNNGNLFSTENEIYLGIEGVFIQVDELEKWACDGDDALNFFNRNK